MPLDADGRPFWRPSALATAWKVVDGAGTVYATTTVRTRDGEPYDVSLLDLDAGVRVMGTVRGGGTVGRRVALVWRDQEGEPPVPEWEPAT